MGTWYSIFLSSTEGGPGDFCIQLESLSRQLEEVGLIITNILMRRVMVMVTNTARPVMMLTIVHDRIELLGDGGSQYNFVDPLAHQPGDQET